MGFSVKTQKRAQYQVGTKLLLSDAIYTDQTKIPECVKGHHFVYEIVENLPDGKHVTLQYKELVIGPGGTKFRGYKDDKDAQVSDYCRMFFVFVLSSYSHLISF